MSPPRLLQVQYANVEAAQYSLTSRQPFISNVNTLEHLAVLNTSGCFRFGAFLSLSPAYHCSLLDDQSNWPQAPFVQQEAPDERGESVEERANRVRQVKYAILSGTAG